MKTEFTHFIHTLAEESARVIMPWFANRELKIEHKADESQVTIADRAAEQIMRELIRKKFPHHGIIGEEFGSENTETEFVWVLDPIDGTASFTMGCPLFGTLIALLQNGNPVLGAIHLPALNQLCLGNCQETRINGKVVRIRESVALAEATLLASAIDTIPEYQSWQRFEVLLKRTKLFRTWGDCYGYVLVAGGWADIMLDPMMNPWDIMALVPIIKGAGGEITDWSGNDVVKGNSCVAATRELHAEVMKILNK
jgi:myo-inositol-1(or 4)-monophosphatase